MILIGLGGQMGAGKDTAAGVLCREFGFVRLGFADALKAELRALYPRTLRAVARLVYGVTEWSSHTAADAVVAQLLADKPAVVRALLQEHGTEVRRTEDPGYWLTRLDTALGRLPMLARVVVPDVRFPDEAAWLRERGAWLARVSRHEALDPDAHPSESSGDAIPWDAVWLNDGTLGALEASVRAWAEEARTHGRL
jgi:hypothetical protein